MLSGRVLGPEMVLPVLRFLERRVTEEGMAVAGVGAWVPNAEVERGEARGGVLTGPGSLDRADWTRSSRFCILERRLRRCIMEEDWGRLACGRESWPRVRDWRMLAEGAVRTMDGPRACVLGFAAEYVG